MQAKPDARITLEGHADQRGSSAFNQALTERRVARVKSFLVENGVPEAAIDTKALGKEHNLTTDEVKQSIEQNLYLTTEEAAKRALARIVLIRMASNRRVKRCHVELCRPDRNLSAAIPLSNSTDGASEPDRLGARARRR